MRNTLRAISQPLRLEGLAERGGFEPPVQLLTVQRFSKPPPSATRPSLRVLLCDYTGCWLYARITRKNYQIKLSIYLRIILKNLLPKLPKIPPNLPNQKNRFPPALGADETHKNYFRQSLIFPFVPTTNVDNFQSCVHLQNPSSQGSSQDSCRLAVSAVR